MLLVSFFDGPYSRQVLMSLPVTSESLKRTLKSLIILLSKFSLLSSHTSHLDEEKKNYDFNQIYLTLTERILSFLFSVLLGE